MSRHQFALSLWERPIVVVARYDRPPSELFVQVLHVDTASDADGGDYAFCGGRSKICTELVSYPMAIGQPLTTRWPSRRTRNSIPRISPGEVSIVGSYRFDR